VLTLPLSPDDLYSRRGDSWRVKPSQSLLCPKPNIQRTNPKIAFTVKNLPKTVVAKAALICRKSGATAALLQACALDNAVMGKAAVEVYAHGPAPAAITKIEASGAKR